MCVFPHSSAPHFKRLQVSHCITASEATWIPSIIYNSYFSAIAFLNWKHFIGFILPFLVTLLEWKTTWHIQNQLSSSRLPASWHQLWPGEPGVSSSLCVLVQNGEMPGWNGTLTPCTAGMCCIGYWKERPTLTTSQPVCYSSQTGTLKKLSAADGLQEPAKGQLTPGVCGNSDAMENLGPVSSTGK